MSYRQCLVALLLMAAVMSPYGAGAAVEPQQLFNPGVLKPVASVLKVAVGDMAPDFTLPAVQGGTVGLSHYRGIKNVVISFVPAAFTPICSGQWPGYNIAQELFEAKDAVLLGITTDNLPSLFAWTHQMAPEGVWFPVLSDFWPHGAVASLYGVLRPEGVTERAILIIDKQGVLRHVEVVDINTRPDLGAIMQALKLLQ